MNDNGDIIEQMRQAIKHKPEKPAEPETKEVWVDYKGRPLTAKQIKAKKQAMEFEAALARRQEYYKKNGSLPELHGGRK